MNLGEFLKPEFIWIKAPSKTQQDVFELVAAKAKETDSVTDEFLSKINEREKTFPTGLQLEGYGVAIPHTDPECVNDQFIAIVTTEDGIPFKRMDDSSKEVHVNVIFVLGLNEPHSQLAVLQQLMSILQNKETVDNILKTENKEEIIHYLAQLSEQK